ncbi:hypothetical protein K435DRAFT_971117 [Dendrothele bispora CBS 962.96]|uniref:C2H2-type domain-containing protein n=1 Tax=Dendrothele bispora (strain CBS 962.96) TaxID=1314807 RepID=A0A4S8L754_DENBC|nr:hypothetical protein K435DRAFT_971117 [Dendrothele bispora CBS 962.96]
MLTVAATSGLSIMIRSKDPHFSLNDIMFITEYQEQDLYQTTHSLNVSISKERDIGGQFIRISFSNSSHPTSRTLGHVNGLQHSDYSSPVQSFQGFQGSNGEPSVYSSYLSSPSPGSTSSQSQTIVGHDDAASAFRQPDSNAAFTMTDNPTEIYSDSLDLNLIHDINTMQTHFTTPAFPLAPPSHTEVFGFSDINGEVLMNYPIATHSIQFPDSDNLNSATCALASPAPSSQYSEPMTDAPVDSISYKDSLIDTITDLSLTSNSSTSVQDPPSDDLTSNDDNTFPEQQPQLSIDPKRTLKCRFAGCTKRFARKYHRQVHENSHKPKLRVPLTCRHPNCTAQFGRPHDRMRHEVAKHGIRPQHICEDCGKFFASQAKLNVHKCDHLPTQRHRYNGSKSGRSIY